MNFFYMECSDFPPGLALHAVQLWDDGQSPQGYKINSRRMSCQGPTFKDL